MGFFKGDRAVAPTRTDLVIQPEDLRRVAMDAQAQPQPQPRSQLEEAHARLRRELAALVQKGTREDEEIERLTEQRRQTRALEDATDAALQKIDEAIASGSAEEAARIERAADEIEKGLQIDEDAFLGRTPT